MVLPCQNAVQKSGGMGKTKGPRHRGDSGPEGHCMHDEEIEAGHEEIDEGLMARSGGGGEDLLLSFSAACPVT